MLDGVRGVVNQIAAIEKRNDLHAGGKQAFIQLFDLRVNRVERRVRLGAFAQQDDARDNVVVVNDASIQAMN